MTIPEFIIVRFPDFGLGDRNRRPEENEAFMQSLGILEEVMALRSLRPWRCCSTARATLVLLFPIGGFDPYVQYSNVNV